MGDPVGYSPEYECPEPCVDFPLQTVVEQDSDTSVRAQKIVVGKGESLLLLGSGGTGKTHLVMELVKELQEREERVIC